MTSALLVSLLLGQLKLGPGGFQCPAGYAIQVYTGTRDKGRCVAVGGSSGGSGLPADPSPCPAGQYVTDQNASGVLTCSTPAGTAPGGSNTQVQFNSGGAFAGTADMTYTSGTRVAQFYRLALGITGTATALSLNNGNQIAWSDGSVMESSSGTIQFSASSGVASRVPWISSQTTGQDAFRIQTPGARLHLSLGGTNDYLYSTGGPAATAAIRTPGVIIADGGFTGTASAATALAADPADCAAGEAARGVAASGAASGCFVPAGTYSLPDAAAAVKGGVQLAGDLAGTAASPSVVDDSHAHTSTTVSGLDAGDVTTGTFAASQIPAATSSTLGGVIVPACSAGFHYSSASAGTLQCTADAGGGGGGMALPYVIAATAFGGF